MFLYTKHLGSVNKTKCFGLFLVSSMMKSLSMFLYKTKYFRLFKQDEVFWALFGLLNDEKFVQFLYKTKYFKLFKQDEVFWALFGLIDNKKLCLCIFVQDKVFQALFGIIKGCAYVFVNKTKNFWLIRPDRAFQALLLKGKSMKCIKYKNTYLMSHKLKQCVLKVL